MHPSSPKINFDNRLLAIEELFRQRKYFEGNRELKELDRSLFEDTSLELGLYLLLVADGSFFGGKYNEAISSGLQSARLLAESPLHRRYARIQLILSKAYYAVGDLKVSGMRARDSLSAYRRADDRNGQVDALNQLAGIAHLQCDYIAAGSFLEDALEMVDGDQRKIAQLTGNLGRTRIRTGQWEQAEQDLNDAIEYNRDDKQEMSLAMNLLSLGYLQLRRRQFILSGRSLDTALEIIARLDLKRERVIYAEYAGELAFERGDTFKAKAILGDAYHRGMLLAPNSALVSQSSRRLAEVELALDNYDDAMKYAQKALDISLMLGEKIEIGLSRAVIARVFGAKDDLDSAAEHLRQSLDILRQVGDPYEMGRTHLALADIYMAAADVDYQRVRNTLDEAYKLFRKLHLDYWMAETNFKAGVFACQHGDLSRGFKKLSRAEKVFSNQQANVRVRAVSTFLRSLAEQAVALSVSDENEFKIFGNLVTADEYTDLKSRDVNDILKVILKRTGGDRALVYIPDEQEPSVHASFSLGTDQVARFCEGFTNLVGEEISTTKPTLILDCRRDPFINGLFADVPDSVCSVMVVPFRISDGTMSFLYIDRLARDNRLDPFNQIQLNFAVGFTDLIAFKWVEFQKVQLVEDNQRLRSQLQKQAAFPAIITQNPQMLSMLSQVRQVVDSNIAIAIEGETGSGKDLLAQAIHYNSNRRAKRFISVNCAALPESLLESELFGYKRGAFTGADRDKAGLFEEADGGTFFLDEIADMPVSIQAKVLRILENQELTRLGDTAPRKVDVRIVSATNKDLNVLMEQGRFRQDLYYRMAAMTFRLPPLRERKEDIPLLVKHFLRETDKQVSAEALRYLVEYDWPGNVRELDNETKKMTLFSGDQTTIATSHLTPRLVAAVKKTPEACSQRPVATPDDVAFGDDYSLYDYLADHEKRFIIRALRQKRRVKKHAAAMLNIPESTLRLKIKQYDIDLDGLPADE
ncbi:MAG: sigma 54-interacting transcriptional regulator [bacterium]